MISITLNQYRIYMWMKRNSSFSRYIRCSSGKLARELDFSQQYADKILKLLATKGLIVLIEQGGGHRGSRYRIPKLLPTDVHVVRSHNQPKSSHNHRPGQDVANPRTYDQVRSHNLDKEPKLFIPGNEREYIGKGTTGASNTREDIFSTPPAPPSRKRTLAASPRQKFAKKWNTPQYWNAQDLVVYYTLLYEFRFQAKPTVEWPQQVGAAQNLLKKVKDSRSAKHYLQLAMAMCKWRPQGIHSLYYIDFYEQVLEKWNDEELVDDMEDAVVYPWLREERLEKVSRGPVLFSKAN